MAKRRFQLSEEQVKEFKRYEHQSKRPDELRRLQAVRLYGMGRAVADICDIVDCAESSLRIWATTYTQSGIAGLLSHYEKSAQNARKLGKEQQQDLREKLHQYCPNQVLAAGSYDSTGQFWTVEAVKAMITQWYGVTYRDASSYRHLLHRCGFSYQKAEQVYKSRPAEVEIADFEAELEKK